MATINRTTAEQQQQRREHNVATQRRCTAPRGTGGRVSRYRTGYEKLPAAWLNLLFAILWVLALFFVWLCRHQPSMFFRMFLLANVRYQAKQKNVAFLCMLHGTHSLHETNSIRLTNKNVDKATLDILVHKTYESTRSHKQLLQTRVRRQEDSAVPQRQQTLQQCGRLPVRPHRS